MFSELEEREALEDVTAMGPPSYPWAAAGIAISHAVAKLFHIARSLPGGAVLLSSLEELRSAKERYWSVVMGDEQSVDIGAQNLGHASADNVPVREMFCRAFRRFDELWREKDARYFDFPNVVAELHERLREDLERSARLIDADVTTSLLGATHDEDEEDLQMDARGMSWGR